MLEGEKDIKHYKDRKQRPLKIHVHERLILSTYCASIEMYVPKRCLGVLFFRLLAG